MGTKIANAIFVKKLAFPSDPRGGATKLRAEKVWADLLLPMMGF